MRLLYILLAIALIDTYWVAPGSDSYNACIGLRAHSVAHMWAEGPTLSPGAYGSAANGDSATNASGKGQPKRAAEATKDNKLGTENEQWIRIGLILAAMLTLLLLGPYYFRFIERKKTGNKPNA